ncbi:MAG: glycosyltransferase family 9 protein, partial [Calditrichaeota bacterium]|nr:glycosyltransferase family 9 protein [Calditrichota bacterium]
LRREKFDLVLTSNNPDNFSLSQALFGRLLGARQLVGFDAKDSAAFYDLAVASSTRIHYSEAMVDLWRPYDGGAKMRLGALHPPEALREKIRRENPALGEKGIVLWLGATGNKILPGTVFAHLYEEIRSFSDLPVHFLAGPADEPHLLSYPAWVREKTVVWKAPLSETAALFSMHDYFISGDTGPMHLAAALNRRLLTLFVDSNLIQYGYRNAPLQEAIIWEDGPDGLVRLRKALGEMLGERPKPAGFASQNNRG